MKEPTIIATNPVTMNKKNFPISLMLATSYSVNLSNYNCLRWGGIAFFFFSIEMAEFMR
jgi:hypothetical protein